jgi:hypothetical protein
MVFYRDLILGLNQPTSTLYSLSNVVREGIEKEDADDLRVWL